MATFKLRLEGNTLKQKAENAFEQLGINESFRVDKTGKSHIRIASLEARASVKREEQRVRQELISAQIREALRSDESIQEFKILLD